MQAKKTFSGAALISILFLAGCGSPDDAHEEMNGSATQTESSETSSPIVEEQTQATQNQKRGKKILSMQSDSWIAWRYFQSRTQIIWATMQSWRCGLKSVSWGLSPEKLDRQIPLGECNEDNPNSMPRDIQSYMYVDDIHTEPEEGESVGSDSFIGLSADSENQESENKTERSRTIDSIYVQATYFDGTKSEIKEFKAPESALGPE